MALHYENSKPTLWIGIGRHTPWKDPDTPPAPSITQTNLDELIGVSRVDDCTLVVPRVDNNPDTGGKPYPPLTANDINYNGQEWEPISDADAYKYGGRWVYFNTLISPEADIPYSTFRQLGIYTGLQPLPQFSSQHSLPASKIADTGTLIAYGNKQLIRYGSDVRLKLEFVAEF